MDTVSAATMQLIRCDAVRCDLDGVEFLQGVLPVTRLYPEPVANVRIRLWLCPEHAEMMLAHGMHR